MARRHTQAESTSIYRKTVSELRKRNQYSKYRFKKLRRILIAGSLISIAICLAALFFYALWFSGGISENHSTWGEFGDFFGGLLNPILALAGYLALLYTIYLQNFEQDRSSSALERQTTESVLGRFESAFFRLLDMHNSIVEDLDLRDPNDSDRQICTGRDVLYDLYTDLQAKRMQLVDLGEDGYKIELDTLYLQVYEAFEHNLAHYFRNFYHILRFVDQAPDEVDKQFYIRVARAQLSTYELTMLFYNGVSDYGKEKLKPLLEKYSILQNLNVDKLIWPEVDLLRYRWNAFDDNRKAKEVFELHDPIVE